MKKRALLSVSDKAGIVDFAKALDKAGYEIISTGGTAEILKKEERYIILELEENNDFTLSYPTKVTSSNDEGYSAIRYRIYFSEIMTPPLKWSIPEFGEFSVKKLDFMCTEMNMTRDMFNDPEYMLASRQQYVGAKMVQILDEYSANGNPIYEDDNVTLMKMGDKYYK